MELSGPSKIEIFFYAGCALLMQYIRKLDRRIFLLPALIVPLTILFGSRGGGLIRFGMPIYALAYWVSTVPVYVCFMLCGVAFYYHYHGRLSYVGLFFLHAFLLAAFVTSMRVGALAMQDWTAPICLSSCLRHIHARLSDPRPDIVFAHFRASANFLAGRYKLSALRYPRRARLHPSCPCARNRHARLGGCGGDACCGSNPRGFTPPVDRIAEPVLRQNPGG